VVDPAGQVDVLLDRSRQLGVLDPGGRELAISVGAAILNLRVAMLAHGRIPGYALLPDPHRPDLAARISAGAACRPASSIQRLAEAIPRRHTNRRPFQDVEVPDPALADLAAAARAEDAVLAVADPLGREGILSLVRMANQRQRGDPSYQAELLRWSTGEPGRRDGIQAHAMGPWDALETIPLRDFGQMVPALPRRAAQFEPTPTLVVLYTAGDQPIDWLRAGQAMQRVLLTATVHGLASTPMTAPVEVPHLRALLRREPDAWVAQVILRLGYGDPVAASARRPVAEVIEPASPV
jgi:nitroreductase